MKRKWKIFRQQFYRNFLINIRQPRLIANTCLFFIMIIVFFPLSLAPDNNLLKQVVPGLIWMTILLSSLLASERLFQQDYEDGVIEQWLIAGNDLTLIVFTKVLLQWLLIIVPIIIICPLLGLIFDFSLTELIVLIMSLFLGSPAILFLCALATAFSTGQQQKGILMALVLLPLAIPIMIFGSATLLATFQHQGVLGYFAILFAFSLICISFLPFAISAVIRISLVE